MTSNLSILFVNVPVLFLVKISWFGSIHLFSIDIPAVFQVLKKGGYTIDQLCLSIDLVHHPCFSLLLGNNKTDAKLKLGRYTS